MDISSVEEEDKKMQKTLTKFLQSLLGTKAAAVYIFLFAVAIGVATFIENDFGTSAAQKVVFKAKWFELLLFLFAGTLINNVIRFRMFQNKRWALITFHLSMVIILIGSGITRYFSYEGVMHIREGDSSNYILSSDTYLQFEAIDQNNKYAFNEPVLFASLGKNFWQRKYLVNNHKTVVKVKDFIPNPIQELTSTPEGKPIIQVVFGGTQGRQEYFIQQGETRRINGLTFNFSETRMPSAFNIEFVQNNLRFNSDQTFIQTVMATQQTDSLNPDPAGHLLQLRALYTNGQQSFVFGDFLPTGKIIVNSESRKVRNESIAALVTEVTVDGKSQEKLVYGQKSVPGKPTIFAFDDLSLSVRYGAKPIQIPFSIKLYDFIMDRYPGTNSAASYASEVQLIDNPKQVQKDYRIFMNHILTYRGFRFFQSSYDPDEKGTYLSVNHDFWGTWVSYIGYILLTIGFILTFFSKKTRFYNVRQKISRLRKLRESAMTLLVLMAFAIPGLTQKSIQPEIATVNEAHASAFSKLIVQDYKGRMKPMHTLSRELIRKVARKESLYDLTADQIILNMFSNKSEWLGIPVISTGKHDEIKQLIGNLGDHAAYKDFFHTDGSYKLRDEVRRAYGLQPIDRGTFEKELMKIDERVNIVSMMFSGSFLKIIPMPNDPNNSWASASPEHGNIARDRTVADKFFNSYQQALHDAKHSDDYAFLDQLVSELSDYQKDQGKTIIPSKTKVNFEIFLNNLNVFNRLALYYFLLGMAFLILLFISVFNTRISIEKGIKIMFALVALGFLFHTLGLGIRWYVSGRAPWSNGYESMIYIGWTSVLAGIIFTRKSMGGMAATMMLAGAILLVSMLSFFDPEITPLVPVLRSYWLTIHVSLIAGSYGFLMLGAIIGIINLLMIIFANKSNGELVKNRVKELSLISEITVFGGLVMLSVGTYLGGVWANESWGRYWGWDAKETWALVTILVYAFILHMRLIPGLRGYYAFNVATLFGMGSVLMTYFGVNYYLSGLHSYAAGDPIPIPNWVFVSIILLAAISVMAYFKKKLLFRNGNPP